MLFPGYSLARARRRIPDLSCYECEAYSSIAYIKAGKLRALAVTAATRSDALPDIPTVAEFVPGYEASIWFGVGAPKATPAEIVDKLNFNFLRDIAPVAGIFRGPNVMVAGND